METKLDNPLSLKPEELQEAMLKLRARKKLQSLLGMNKTGYKAFFSSRTQQAVGMRPGVQVLPSVASALNQPWATDLHRVRDGCDG